MRSSEAVSAKIAETIRNVYKHPQMYNALDHIESTLWDFHWVWAVIHEAESLFPEIRSSVYGQTSIDLWRTYVFQNPNAKEEEVLAYVFSKWKTISTKLKVPLDISDVMPTDSST